MDLAPETTEGLQIAASSVRIPEECYRSLIAAVFNNAVATDDPHVNIKEIVGIETVEVAALKQAYAALVIVVVEAAKYDVDATKLGSLLEECRFSPERSNFFIDAFMHHKPRIRVHLGRFGNYLPHIVDVDWKLDFRVKSDLLDKTNEPNYLVTLKTQKSDQAKTEDVQFSCTLEQMQDLVGKLKEAVKCVEKNAQL